MTYHLGQASVGRLAGVHPDLCRVVARAIELTKQDFYVLEGLRTLERQKEYLKAGTSRTLDSRHLTGHAVDLLPYHVGGGRVWPEQTKDPVERKRRFAAFFEVASAILAAADELNIPIQWGNDWDGDGTTVGPDPDEDFPDLPHFQLPRGTHIARAQEARTRRMAERAAGKTRVI